MTPQVSVVKVPRDLDSTDGIHCVIRGWVAYDPVSGAYLYCSRGQRKPGRPSFYVVQRGPRGPWNRFTAYTDEQAIQKANTWLAENL